MISLFVSAALLLGSTGTPSGHPLASYSDADTLPTRCQTLPASKDSLEQTLSVRVTSRDTAVKVTPEYAQALGHAVATHFHAPEPLELTVVTTGGSATDSTTVHPTVDTHAYVTVYRRGGVSEPVVIGGSLNLDLDEALSNAFHAVDSAKAFPAFPAGVTADSLLLSVQLSSVPAATTDWVKVKDLRIPQYHLDAPVRQVGALQPTYPEEAKARAVNGTVALTFVVDEAGKVIMPTVDATRADYREFLQATLQTLPNIQFTPAKLAGCPVKQHVAQTFTFTPPGK